MDKIHHLRMTTLVLVALFLLFVTAQGSQLLCANRETMRRLDLDTGAYATILTDLKKSVGVDFHYRKGLVVWTDVVAAKIYSSPVSSDGPKRPLVEVCVIPDVVAVDWVHDNLYWTDSGKDVIGVARLDGKHVTTLLSSDMDKPRAIVLDPHEGLMFWTDWGSRPKIERSGMDADHRQVIVSDDLYRPNGFAIDLAERTLYWTDGIAHALWRSDYNGVNRRTIMYSPTLMRRPNSLDLLGEWLYWTEFTPFGKSVYKATKSGGGAQEVVGGRDWGKLMGIRVYDAEKQPPGDNRCGSDNGGCTHLCLPSWRGLAAMRRYKCLCPDEILATDNCSTTPIRSSSSLLDTTVSSWSESSTRSFKSSGVDSNSDVVLTESQNSTGEQRILHEITTETHVPPGGIILIVLGLLSAAGVAFFGHKWYSKRARGQASVSGGGIDNPVYATEDQSSFAKPPPDAYV